MKRVTAIFLILLLALTVPACAAAETPSAPAEGREAGFSDVPADAWYAEAVRFVSERGWMNGTGESRFSPEDPFTRAQLATVLYRMAGEPAVTETEGFSDTAPGSWYDTAVRWAKGAGVVNGIGGGKFGPDDPVTREQMTVMLWRMAGEPKATSAEDASDYAAEAVGWARARGILPRNAETEPKTAATRGFVAALLQGYSTADKDDPSAGITLTVAGKELTVQWADNSTVTALRDLLEQGEITLDMGDYGGFEKGAALPETLPQNNEPMNADAGDVILYQGRQFVIYYDRNSYDLTPLGKITGLTKAELQGLLGAGNVTATLSLGKTPETAGSGRTLVAFFSATGNTRPLAEYAAAYVGADLYEIVPETPYTPADLDYTDSASRASREQNDPTARPPIDGELPDPRDYDTVILGHPIWYGQAPKILYTFLEEFDSAGKTLVTFCTSHSSPLGTSAENLKQAAPEATWLESRRFAIGSSRQAVEQWLDGIGLTKNDR